MSTPPAADDLIALALAEDLGVSPSDLLAGGHLLPEFPVVGDVLARDVTSHSVVPAAARFDGVIVAREEAVVCGLPYAERTWAMLARAAGSPDAVEVFPLVAEGTRVASGRAVAEVSGSARVVLAGERTALDLVMVLSGIATETARWQEAAGPDLTVCDTRKTWPGLRALSKYAVLVGGGTNHRQGLWDMVLVKDNHVRAAGGIRAAVGAARKAHPDLIVEVEADSMAAAVDAARSGADIVMLDNMDDESLTAAVAAVREACSQIGRTDCTTEASGGITFDRIPALRESGVDRVSSSAITLAPPVDFGFDELRSAEGLSAVAPDVGEGSL